MLLAPFTGVCSWYNRTAQQHPFAVGVVTTGLKTSAADVFAQKVRRSGCRGAALGGACLGWWRAVWGASPLCKRDTAP